MQIDTGGCSIRLTHGTPAGDCVYLLDDIAGVTAQLRDHAEINALLPDNRAALVLCVIAISRAANGTVIVNPGSVGLPAYDDKLPVHHRMETHSPMASNAVIEIEYGEIAVEMLRVPYCSAAARQARENNRSDWAAWIETGLV